MHQASAPIQKDSQSSMHKASRINLERHCSPKLTIRLAYGNRWTRLNELLSVTQSINQPINQQINQSTKQLINQVTNQSITQLIENSKDLSISQLMDQWIDNESSSRDSISSIRSSPERFYQLESPKHQETITQAYRNRWTRLNHSFVNTSTNQPVKK